MSLARHHRLPVATVLLVLAAATALWLRTDDASTVAERKSVATSQRLSLADARAEAALRPCPAATPGISAQGPLAGVRATCLRDGATIDVGAALVGRTALIHVWAPAQRACRRELMVLDQYTKSGGNLPVIGVQVRGGAADGLRLLTELSVQMPTILDHGAMSDALAAPSNGSATYLLAEDGNVHPLRSGPPFTSEEQVQAAIDSHAGGVR